MWHAKACRASCCMRSPATFNTNKFSLFFRNALSLSLLGAVFRMRAGCMRPTTCPLLYIRLYVLNKVTHHTSTEHYDSSSRCRTQDILTHYKKKNTNNIHEYIYNIYLYVCFLFSFPIFILFLSNLQKRYICNTQPSNTQ